MNTVLFVDECCPKPYDDKTLITSPQGGTESTVTRIAEGLTPYYKVIVEQKGRTEEYTSPTGAIYATVGSTLKAQFTVSLRRPETALMVVQRFPNSINYLWNHDLGTPNNHIEELGKNRIDSIAVSNFHKTQLTDAWRSVGYNGQFRIKTIYNLIENNLKPDETEVDSNKLVWTSSPHKGLKHALNLFMRLIEFNPKFNLTITNPGYVGLDEIKHPNVRFLGSIPYPEVIKEVRSSLCLFYPNTVFPETFGLVMAEANAVGTPVLTHRLGASSEVTDHPQEVIDCYDNKKVIDRVMAWHNGERPIVRGREQFRLSAVIKEWRNILK